MKTQDKEKRNLIILVIASMIFMKIVSEAFHEILGHGFFVLLLGGSIRNVYLSVFWPYELSHISWSIPSLDTSQLVLLYGGGILVTALTSLLLQIILLVFQPNWKYTIPLTWLAFWCLVNAAGYLVVGGVFPFGDVAVLMNLDAISAFQSLLIGTGLLVVGFFSISHIQRKALQPILPAQAAYGNIIMWGIVLLVTFAASAGLGIFSPLVLGAGLIPLSMSIALEWSIRRKANRCF
ncbi:MAG: hypothetical protein ACQET3_04080 [Promethearchaeati archaeon]